MRKGLPLRLVHSHGISQLQRKLLLYKCKWQTVDIGNELNVRDKGHITGSFACDDLSFNDSHCEVLNNQTHPIA
jgi:hypothetical protein